MIELSIFNLSEKYRFLTKKKKSAFLCIDAFGNHFFRPKLGIPEMLMKRGHEGRQKIIDHAYSSYEIENIKKSWVP